MAGMNLLDMIMQSGGKPALKSAGAHAGLNQSQTQKALMALLPAVSSGLKRNTQSPQGLGALLGALQNGSHDQYLENPASLNTESTVNDGNAILGHLFGSKDVSRAVAAHASEKSGLPVDALKKMLPLVAAMAMGSLSKQTKGGDMKGALAGLAMQHLMGGQRQSSGLGGLLGALTGAPQRQQRRATAAHSQGMGMLGSLLDADGDGNSMDDILGMAMKQFLK